MNRGRLLILPLTEILQMPALSIGAPFWDDMNTMLSHAPEKIEHI